MIHLHASQYRIRRERGITFPSEVLLLLQAIWYIMPLGITLSMSSDTFYTPVILFESDTVKHRSFDSVLAFRNSCSCYTTLITCNFNNIPLSTIYVNTVRQNLPFRNIMIIDSLYNAFILYLLLQIKRMINLSKTCPNHLILL